MPCTRRGRVAGGVLAGFIGLLAAGSAVSRGATPNGELGLFYELPACANLNQSFTLVSTGDAFDAYTLRPLDGATEVGSACPVVPGLASPLNVSLEPDDGIDGWRLGATYRPVLMLPSAAYASLAIEVVDASGAVLVATEVLSLGPDERYPWMADSDKAPLAPLNPPVEAAVCGECDPSLPCDYADDGACDDGGAGAAYDLCLLGHDCVDCGTRTCAEFPPPPSPPPPPPPGGSARRLNAASERALLFADAQSSPWLEAPMAANEPEDGSVGPGARRLLKGGFGSSGSGGGRAGGRAGIVGTARWGSATPTRFASRTYGRSSGYRAASGTVYGGSRSYYVGGTRYYAGSRPGYWYGHRSVPMGAAIVVVGHRGYGCYSCARRTCTECESCCPADGLCSRKACDVESASVARTHLDRYEIELPLDTPAALDGAWPLELRVVNMSIWLPREARVEAGAGVGGDAAYLTFFTDEGDSALAFSSTVVPLGAVGLVLLVLFIVCNWSSLWVDEAPPPTRPKRQV
jgi:hypothetical protein